MKTLATLFGALALLLVFTPIARADGVTLAQERQRAVDEVNRYRAQAGLTKVSVASPLNSAASGHARYQIETGELGHFETLKTNPLYVEYGPLERARRYGYTRTGVSEDWMGTSLGATGARTYFTADNSVQWWMSAIYHRLPIIRPGTSSIGYGTHRKDNLSVAVLNFGTNLNVAGPVVRWPRPNATGVGVFVKREFPNPLEKCGLTSDTMGYPVSMSFHTGTVAATSVTMKRADSGLQVAGCNLTPANDQRHANAKSISIVPVQPLAYNTRYTVSFQGKVNGTAFNSIWSFTTMPGPGRLVSSSPTPGATGTTLQPTVALNFSLPIRSYTLVRSPYSQLGYTGLGASLSPAAGGREVGFTIVQPSGTATRAVYLKPSAALEPNTKYRVSFAFSDLWGRPQRGTVYFTTGR